MNLELQAFNQRIEASIRRIPDCLSRLPDGASIRAEFARIFGMCIGGMERPTGMYSLLPMHLSLLTDPHLFIVPGGFIVLDHPTRSGEFDWSFDLDGRRGVQVHDAPAWWSLYENRHPRIIACRHMGDEFLLSAMTNRLTREDFHGPFEMRPTLVVVGPSTGPFRSVASRARTWRSVGGDTR
jgi:hypothetical protein